MISPTSVRPRAVTLGEGLAVLVARPGPLEDSATFERTAGGAEANVATVLAQLDVEAGWISRVGNDGFGRYLVRHLARRGIDVVRGRHRPRSPDGGVRQGTRRRLRGGGRPGRRREPHALLPHRIRRERTVAGRPHGSGSQATARQVGARARHRDYHRAVGIGDPADRRARFDAPAWPLGQLRSELPARAVGHAIGGRVRGARAARPAQRRRFPGRRRGAGGIRNRQSGAVARVVPRARAPDRQERRAHRHRVPGWRAGRRAGAAPGRGGEDRCRRRLCRRLPRRTPAWTRARGADSAGAPLRRRGLDRPWRRRRVAAARAARGTRSAGPGGVGTAGLCATPAKPRGA